MATTTTAAKKTVAATKKTTTTPDTPRAPKHLSKASAEFFRNALDAFQLDEHHIILLVKALESFDLRGFEVRYSLGFTHCPLPNWLLVYASSGSRELSTREGLD